MSSVDPTVDCDSLPLVFFSQYCLHSTLMSLSSDFVLIEFFYLPDGFCLWRLWWCGGGGGGHEGLRVFLVLAKAGNTN